MSASRLAAIVVLLATPAIAYRLGGTNLWIVNAVGTTVAAAIALYVLWQDGMLEDVVKPQGLDVSSGFLAAATMYTVIVLAWAFLIAPADEAAGLLRRCSLHGVLVPRENAHGVRAVLEFARAQTCAGYGASLGLTGPARGAAILAIAVLEEIGWRGGVQQALSEKVGTTRGWIAASMLYALAHAATGNVLLGLVALAGGLVWGGLYRYRGRLVPGVFSHAVFSYFLFYMRPLVGF
ncbi:MAG: CPBP family intramembrane glutamic endopeptidase [Deltaproteobacteria bacterium]